MQNQILLLSLYQQTQRTMITFEQFVRQNTKSNERGCRILSSFFERFPKMTMSQAYQSEVERWNEIKTRSERVSKFEAFLQQQGCQEVQSNISESRYYFYKGVKYRFSAHIYPTGSMTKRYEDGSYAIVDFAADPEIINQITY